MGGRESWGWANTSTILSFDTSFDSLGEEDLKREERFFSGTLNKQVITSN